MNFNNCYAPWWWDTIQLDNNLVFNSVMALNTNQRRKNVKSTHLMEQYRTIQKQYFTLENTRRVPQVRNSIYEYILSSKLIFAQFTIFIYHQKIANFGKQMQYVGVGGCPLPTSWVISVSAPASLCLNHFSLSQLFFLLIFLETY